MLVGTLCFAKLSILLLLRTISPVKSHRNTILVVECTIIFWAFTAELVAAFQCHPPNTWQFIGNTCIKRVFYLHRHK